MGSQTHKFSVTKRLLDAVTKDNVDGAVYRGHADANWALLPAVWRDGRRGIDARLRLVRWRELVEGITPSIPREDFLKWLVLAQHHGIATPILDWTRNPLVALYFACSEFDTDDGKILRLDVDKHQRMKGRDPFDFEGPPRWVDPHGLHPRAYSQFSFMTLHNENSRTVDPSTVRSLLTLSPDDKVSARQELTSLGITGARLFADVVGVAQQFRREIGDD